MTQKKYLVALDQGTTSSRAIVFDRQTRIVSFAQKELTQHYPHSGYVEHDPEELFQSQYHVLLQALTEKNIAADEIYSIGITNQRETTILWDKNTGKPVCNAIVWQCRRSAALCEELKSLDCEPYIRESTGLRLDPYFSATKIMWILRNIEGARDKALRGELLFGTVDTWLLWKLTGGQVHATDYTNASRTLLFNISTLRWDEKLLQMFDIPASLLPEAHPSSHIYGYTMLDGVQIPIAGIAGDQQAALFGQACFEKGQLKNTYGTGCFLLMNTGESRIASRRGLLTTIGIALSDRICYAKVYRPSMPEEKRRSLLAGWKKAVGKAMDWAE